VRRLILRQGLGLAVLGLVSGVILAAASTRLLEGMLVGVRAHDPLTVGTAVALLIATAFVAADLPARRAAHVDPAQALRAD
jgi:ABC-type antimicrobial peptide transport system permease subunit